MSYIKAVLIAVLFVVAVTAIAVSLTLLVVMPE